jgi:hypothetical protein
VRQGSLDRLWVTKIRTGRNVKESPISNTTGTSVNPPRELRIVCHRKEDFVR